MGLIIRGRLTELRPANPEDSELLFVWLNDPEVYRWWGGGPVSRETIEQKYTGARSPSVMNYIIENDGVPIDYIQSSMASPASCGLDIFLDPTRRGRGFATDVVHAICEFLTTVEEIRVITADPEGSSNLSIRHRVPTAMRTHGWH
ncbi:MAG TPA: GNAT family N-acetyltransferase [Candidatus Nanopelagicaceae bacterium]|nr:GNAT family N-acetyltransferase [Candidatus Nanopelagicaceae bacterium]